ncbi:amino acid adenylation domain-containing protein [Actinocorallia sp. B10E7]|uniref:amino acid adenylation domain-containing protein n=1 Tax=Actinocorallia sp. B10E7 TaxID=3153558 RepID=UPI00325CDDC3
MRVLVVDAFDSFVHTLCQYLRSAGVEASTIRNDEVSPEYVRSVRPDALLLGPGPGHPADAGYVELVRELAGRLPILGVCLGHQAIGLAYGAQVVPAMHLVHGKSSQISHDGTGVLTGLGADFRATRYHSLIVADGSVPDSLRITARSRDDGYVMGLRHHGLPVESVQFHPESVGTENGLLMIENFVEQSKGYPAWRERVEGAGRHVLEAVNDTAAPLPEGHVHELIERVCRDTPDAPAVVQGEEVTTFGELDARCDRLARHLAGLGVRDGSPVGVLLERGTDAVVAQLAVFKAGGTVVLLDPQYPPDRLAFMVPDSSAVAVVTSDAFRDRLPEGTPAVLSDSEEWADGPPLPPVSRITDDSVSHIAYTSGSTGRPKAVALRHGPFRNTVHAMRTQCGIDPGSRGSWSCSPGAGLVEVDFFPVLAAGACLHIPDQETAASPELLRDWLVAERITHTLQPTAMAERLWRLAWPEDTALRSMRIAGERVRSWPPPGLPFTVLNVYGSSEANVVATCDLTALAAGLTPRERETRRPPIGRPVANVRVYVLDDGLGLVEPGEVGELHVSGRSLSLGYLNRPDENEARFRPNTLPEDPYPVLYRTGDLARYDRDGLVEVVGRTDSEIKIRGYRVHLGEIESVLAGRPGVRQCAVLARDDGAGGLRLVAYVEPDPARPVRIPEVRAALGRVLPPYMLPSAYVVMELPTSPNGKIDRAALPAPSSSRPELEVPYRAPGTEAERELVRLWEEVLGIEGIGVDDDFHQLGGDSLRATRLLAAVRARFEGEIGMSDLFGAPSVAGLAALVEGRGEVAGADPALRYAPFPLTPAQRDLWAAAGFRQPAPDVYEWRLDWLDEERFLEAWRAVAARHDALRTTVNPDGTQVAHREAEAPDVIDLGDVSPEEAERRLAASRTLLRAEERPHRLRVGLLPGGGACVQLAVQPLVVDADSVHHVVLPDLAAHYEDPSSARVLPSFTFRDHVGALRPEQAAPARRGAGVGHGDRLVHAFADLGPKAFTRLLERTGSETEDVLADVLRAVAPEATLLVRSSRRAPHLAFLAGHFSYIRTLREGSGETVLLTVQTDAADAPSAPSVVVSSSPFADLDVRAVLGADGLRLHVAGDDPDRVRALLDAYAERLRAVAS